MADAMDLVQQRVEEERQRHIRTARAKTFGAYPACFALSVKHQFRQHDVAPFGCAALHYLSGNRRAERQTLQRRCCMSTILKWAGNKTAIMPELKNTFLLARDWLNLSRVLVL